MAQLNDSLDYAGVVLWAEHFVISIAVTNGTPIADVTLAFINNVERCVASAHFGATAAAVGRKYQATMDIARIKLLQRLEAISGDETREAEVCSLAQSIYPSVQISLPDKNKSEMEHAAEMVGDIASRARGARLGIEAVLQGVVLGVWAAFETMAGDLWEAAINLHPEGLAELKGNVKGNKGEKRMDSETHRTKQALRTEKIVLSLKHIKRLGYATEGKMGTLLKSVANFNSIRGIREAYRSAFWIDDERIEKAIDYHKLRKLSLVRNLLIHRNGKVDTDFLEEAAGYPDLVAHKLGDVLSLNGGTMLALIEPAIECSKDLIQAVDQWVASH
jgi:hypothetical protein